MVHLIINWHDYKALNCKLYSTRKKLTPILHSSPLFQTQILLSLDFCMLLESKEYTNSAIFLAEFHWLVNWLIQQTCTGPALGLDHSTRVRE